MIQHRFYAPKGGQGTTVVACAFALQQPGRTLLVDDRGDCAAALGMAQPVAGGEIVTVLTADILNGGTGGLDLLVLDDHVVPDPIAGDVLDRYDQVVYDGDPPTSATLTKEVRAEFGLCTITETMVIRADYLALRRAIGIRTPDRVVLIMEPGRALRPVDVARSLGIPENSITVVDIDPAIARAVDAGLLACRLPASLKGLAHHE